MGQETGKFLTCTCDASTFEEANRSEFVRNKNRGGWYENAGTAADADGYDVGGSWKRSSKVADAAQQHTPAAPRSVTATMVLNAAQKAKDTVAEVCATGGAKRSYTAQEMLGFDLIKSARNGDSMGIALALAQGAGVETRKPMMMNVKKEPAHRKRVEETGLTPLMLAAQSGSAESVAALLHAGADVHSIEEEDWRPLHFAVKSGSLEVCELLIRAGADLKATTVHGVTCLDMATEHYGMHKKLLKLREEYKGV